MKEAKKFLSMFLAAAITVTSIGFATPQNVNAASGKQYAVKEQEAVVTASDGDLLCLAQAVSASDGLAKVVSPGEGEEKNSVYGDTWTSVNTALQSAKLVQAKGTDATKQEVKNVLMGLESALKGLKVVTAEDGQLAVEVTADDGDEALLNAAKTEAAKKSQDDYTSETWSVFASALDAAKALNAKKTTKRNVVCAIVALSRASVSLVAKEEGPVDPFVSPDEADIKALNDALTEAEQKEEEKYTAQTWGPFAEALAAARNVKKSLDDGEKVTKKQVQDATKALVDAMNALVEKEPEPLVRPSQADIEALNNAVAEADKKNQAEYTEKSWVPFAKALADAKAVQAELAKEDNEVSKDQVVDATEDLINKTENLVGKPADKVALKAAIKAAEEKHQMDYTAETWYPFLAALVTARNVDADDNALQSKVDAATERLVAKTNALVLKPTAEVDKTELKAAIDAAEAKKEADYTAETWAPFAAALKAAKDTYANETAKQSDIETAIDDLAAATKALKEKEVVEPPVEPANKTKLNAAITAAGKLKKADYTPSTWSKFNTALTAAKTVNNNSKATQSDVDKATTALTNAQKALKKAVKSITISSEYGTSLKIAAGKSVTLKATASPSSAANKAVTWSIATKDKKYATVNKSGKVTTKKAGAGKTVTVTATAKDGSKKKKTIKVTIMKNAVTKITVKAPKSVKKNTVKANQKVSLKATVKTNGSKANKTLTWKSSNTKYATVDKKGKVSIKKAGKGKSVTITATATDGTKKKGTIKLKIKK